MNAPTAIILDNTKSSRNFSATPTRTVDQSYIYAPARDPSENYSTPACLMSGPRHAGQMQAGTASLVYARVCSVSRSCARAVHASISSLIFLLNPLRICFPNSARLRETLPRHIPEGLQTPSCLGCLGDNDFHRPRFCVFWWRHGTWLPCKAQGDDGSTPARG